MAYKVWPIEQCKRIALVAHDNKKQDLLEWAKWNRDLLVEWELIRLALMSVAYTAINPLQDVLGVGSEGRMNTPGRAGGNWGWRYAQAMLTPDRASRLVELTDASGRKPGS